MPLRWRTFEGSTGYHTYWKESKAVHYAPGRSVRYGQRRGVWVSSAGSEGRWAGVGSPSWDSRGNLWVGGDINRQLGANGEQRTVVFTRFASRCDRPRLRRTCRFSVMVRPISCLGLAFVRAVLATRCYVMTAWLLRSRAPATRLSILMAPATTCVPSMHWELSASTGAAQA